MIPSMKRFSSYVKCQRSTPNGIHTHISSLRLIFDASFCHCSNVSACIYLYSQPNVQCKFYWRYNVGSSDSCLTIHKRNYKSVATWGGGENPPLPSPGVWKLRPDRCGLWFGHHIQLDDITLGSKHQTRSKYIPKWPTYSVSKLFPVLSPIQTLAINFTLGWRVRIQRFPSQFEV